MFLVILYHSCVFWTGNWFTVIEVKQSAEYLSVIAKWINTFHVYAFTLISGYIFAYLLFEKGKYQTLSELIKAKAKRLLVPYIFVSIIWVIPIGQIFYHYSIKELIKKYLFAVSPSQLWFLIMLFWCFLGAWSLNSIIRKSSCATIIIIIVSGCIGTVAGIFVENYFCIWSAFQFFPVFVIGMKLRENRIGNWCDVIPIWCYCVTDILLFMIWMILERNNDLLFNILSAGVGFVLHIIGALMAFRILQWIGSRVKWNNSLLFVRLCVYSMPIYLFHQQVIYITIYCLNGRIEPLLNVAVNFLVATVVSLIISICLSQWRITKFLIGS